MKTKQLVTSTKFLQYGNRGLCKKPDGKYLITRGKTLILGPASVVLGGQKKCSPEPLADN